MMRMMPLSKRAVLIGKVRIAITFSIDPTARKESPEKIATLFINSGCPKKLVKGILLNTPYNIHHARNDDKKNVNYLKILF